jgi:hypothetical protein
MQATWTKLRDGSWGIRVAGPARQGESFEVRSKDGRISLATVARVVWTNGEVTLAAVYHFPKASAERCTCSCHRGGGSPCGDCRFDECPVVERARARAR